MIANRLKQDTKLNEEYRMHGIGNLFNTIVGGYPTQLVLANTAFNEICGGKTLVSSITVLITMGCFFFIPSTLIIIGYIPRFLLSGSLIFMTIDFFKESLFDSLWEYTMLDKLIVFIILISSAFSNITIGLAVGIVICFLRYIYQTSDSQFISKVENYHVNDIYHIPKNCNVNDTIMIFHINGFLFFGSCIRVCNQIETEIMKVDQLSYIIVDFTDISGFDTTSIFTTSDLTIKYLRKKITVCLVFKSEKIKQRVYTIISSRINSDEAHYLHVFLTLELAKTFCETNFASYYYH